MRGERAHCSGCHQEISPAMVLSGVPGGAFVIGEVRARVLRVSEK